MHSGQRTFGLSTAMIIVAMAALLFSLFRLAAALGIIGSIMSLAGFASVMLANAWRKAQGRPTLTVAQTLLDFLWVGFLSVAWALMGALMAVFPALALVGDRLSSEITASFAGGAGALLGMTITVYRGAIWGFEQ